MDEERRKKLEALTSNYMEDVMMLGLTVAELVAELTLVKFVLLHKLVGEQKNDLAAYLKGLREEQN